MPAGSRKRFVQKEPCGMKTGAGRFPENPPIPRFWLPIRPLALDFLVAPPQMAHYMECSGRIYQIYLKYVAPEDIHVYSIDEVFMDITDYLPACKMDAHELTKTMIRDVLSSTGITATRRDRHQSVPGKGAMDIVASM